MRWSPPSARSRVREGAAALVALHQPGGHARRAPGHPHAAHVQDVRAPPGPGRPADARARCRELGAVGRGRGLCPLRRDRRSRPQETALRPHARVEGHLQPLGGAVPIVGTSRVRAGLDAHAPLHRRVHRSRRQASPHPRQLEPSAGRRGRVTEPGARRPLSRAGHGDVHALLPGEAEAVARRAVRMGGRRCHGHRLPGSRSHQSSRPRGLARPPGARRTGVERTLRRSGAEGADGRAPAAGAPRAGG